MIKKAKKLNLKTLVLRQCKRITSNGWIYLANILNTTSIVNLDLSQCNISLVHITQIINAILNTNRIVNLDLNPQLTRFILETLLNY